MTQAPKADAVTQAFSEIPALLEAAPALMTRGRFLDCDCGLGPMVQPFLVSIRAGRIVEFTAQASLLHAGRHQAHGSFDPGPRVTIMAELGHFPMSENPEQFRRYIASVLAEITKAKTSPKQGVHA